MRPLAALLACLTLSVTFAACAHQGDIAPHGVTEPPVVIPSAPVTPEVEAWFRATEPGQPDRLIAGDRVQIVIQGRDAFTVSRAIPAGGAVPLYKAGVVQAIGKTPVELEAEVAQAYAEQFADPYVTVNVLTRAPRFVYVTGAVGSSQQLSLGGEGLTVMQAIARSGGHSDKADMRRVRITRYHPGEGKSVTSPELDLQAVLDFGEQKDNLYLAPGDTVLVPDVSTFLVYVFGHVENPGSVAWRPGLTLAMAVTECGGFRQYARITRIAIVRKGEPAMTFDFDMVIDGESQDLELRPGDRVFVPESPI